MNIILDYGLGNLGSVETAFLRAGIASKVTSNVQEIEACTSLVIPGVGAFRDGIEALHLSGAIPYIHKHVASGKPLLGICLGMQLLYELSYENGKYAGLGFLEGTVEKLDVPYKIPHMGWNALKLQKEDEVMKYIAEGDFVYFVHSYYVNSSNEEVLAYADYGVKVPAIVRKGNVIGMQFHPEKSATVGANLIKAYGELIS
ncbi:imidazole glycerol phosphate synthase subunit HisH [Lottiidibacillus patelloidae]|uniref:Imidazole glycerol phosphate synthase subunit HisH n=1 Tax=Lottiidibacillus patelloidae TaxID=2670334 RepID=A0A263BTE4_9BACI|nr:imidazole glycerol phosphate synthase subunit HisH [Lottiidibacillus patelloidae]OZM56993.1 imidazole glycerol phosphate synthase subunit HisH [Lottiidibacillus patelloidae]